MMNSKIYKKKPCLVFSALIIALAFFPCFGSTAAIGHTVTDTVPLTSDEKQWIEQHPVIRLAPDPQFQPIEFFDSTGKYSGIGADYTALLSEKLGITFEIVRCRNWDEVVERVKRREVDVLNAVVKTPQREEYLVFPPPYLKIPSVIIVKKSVTRKLSLRMLKGLHVVMVSGYGYVDLIRNRHPELKIELAPDLKTALQKVSFGMADAFVGDLATASFYIEKQGITNLKLAGESDPPNISGFAVRSDWPELSGILAKGISHLTEAEKNTIFSKWIHLKSDTGIALGEFKKLMAIIIGIAIFIFIAFILWNRQLKKIVKLKTEDLTREIQERKRTDEALKESEHHLRTTLMAIPDLVWFKNPEGVYLSCNAKFERFFGAKESEIVGKTDYDFLEKDKAATFAGVPTVNEEEVTYADDGHKELLETIKTPMFDLNNNLTGVLGIARDITLRKKTEDALRYEKAFTDKALNAQKDTFFLFDPENYKALRWNKSFVDITGYTPEEIAELPALKSYHSPADLEKIDLFLKKITDEGIGTIELELICKDGRKVPTEYSVSAVYDEHGKPKFFISVGRDMTERKKNAAHLQQAQKLEAIGTLAGGIAHDFNNMLGVITGNISFALHNISRDDELFSVLSDIQESARQAQGLTHQLLTFSKGGAPIKKPSDINRLLNKASLFSVRGANAKCVFNLSESLWPAEVDEGQINQVIGNLVINATQAMPKGGEITIRTENTELSADNNLSLPAGPYIKIAIEDQGIGISKNHISNIFEPYYSTKQKGSGLGLATSYSIIKRHGGLITVYSEIEKGAVFNIYLPAGTKNITSPTENDIPLHRGEGRILIMDDQESILKMAERMLNKMGYETSIAFDGHEAIAKYREAYHSENPFLLVILDLTVPGGMGGARVIPELMKIDPEVKAIVSSGYSNDPIMANYEDYGFCDVAPKPYTAAQLSETLSGIWREK